MKNYLNSLVRKHRILDAQIEKVRHDVLQARKLKKMRLQLKDRIQLIRRTSSSIGVRQTA
ncbi:MAG: YdcH family protein [Parasphingorhabdus sp.]